MKNMRKRMSFLMMKKGKLKSMFLGIMNWYIKCLKQYFDFDGRARRKEYWMYVLINVIITAILMTIDYLLGWFDIQYRIGVLSGIYAVAVCLPGLAVCVRRLHDIGKSGWYYLLGLIPIVGPIILLVYYCTEGDRFENAWGEDPKKDEP